MEAQRLSLYPGWPAPVAVRLVEQAGEACAYLPGRVTRVRAFLGDGMGNELYHAFMDAGFRRSGRVVYQPVCERCRECVPLRVVVERFRLSKSQRRCWKANRDVRVTVGRPEVTAEKFAAYEKYQRAWHGKTEGVTQDSMAAFLYESPVETVEFVYRDAAGKLLAVGICDVAERALSSVYFYFDPAEAHRGLGTFGALVEIDFARRQDMTWVYLGYWVKGCGAMAYKANFSGNEVLGTDGVWR